jgi:Thioredoxin like C-terminal domain
VRGASIHARVTARKVFLVLGTSDGRPHAGRVLVDGKPIADSDAGADVSGGRLSVSQQRLYRLVALPKVEDRTLTIELAPGTTAYAFTFG